MLSILFRNNDCRKMSDKYQYKYLYRVLIKFQNGGRYSIRLIHFNIFAKI